VTELADLDPKEHAVMVEEHLTAARNYLAIAEEAFTVAWPSGGRPPVATNGELQVWQSAASQLKDALKLSDGHRAAAWALKIHAPMPAARTAPFPPPGLWSGPLPQTPPEAYVPPIPVRHVTEDELNAADDVLSPYALPPGFSDGYRAGVRRALDRVAEAMRKAGKHRSEAWARECADLPADAVWPDAPAYKGAVVRVNDPAADLPPLSADQLDALYRAVADEYSTRSRAAKGSRT
jgi:hypothetical protein